MTAAANCSNGRRLPRSLHRGLFRPVDSHHHKYAEIARRTTSLELNASWSRARELGLKFETTTFERLDPFSMTAMFGM